MLDKKHSLFALANHFGEQATELFCFGLVQTRRWLVEEKETWIPRQEPRQLHDSPPAGGQCAGSDIRYIRKGRGCQDLVHTFVHPLAEGTPPGADTQQRERVIR